jgi:UDP-N-acetylglucosamine--N-acetylmuramyl-(pentapeptide) pyrophosphoryl-undecaprenol N-acetylglucosamine transferase
VAFAETDLPRRRVTGAPVREEITRVDRAEPSRACARRALGIPEDRATVAVFGGSLGARRVNDAAAALAAGWRGRGDLTLYHVTGRRDFDRYRAHGAAGEPGAQASGTAEGGAAVLCYRTVAFEDRMARLYEAADVVVCRAGALSVAELAVAGVPSVLVPLPGAPGAHQTANAASLATRGAAVLLADAACDGPRLQQTLEELLGDPARLLAMGEAAKAAGRPDAAAQVATLVAEQVR